MTAEPEVWAALLTARAPGAIAVIGMAGRQIAPMLERAVIARSGPQLLLPPLDRPSVGRLVDNGTVLDDVVVTCACSAAGLPIAELCVHGGVRVAQRTLMLLERLGARVVTPWEWHRRFGGANAVEADVDEALAHCASRKLARWLVHQRELLPPFLSAWTSHDPATRAAYLARTAAAQPLMRGLHIVLVGPPNAGKSTLANRLIGRPRVITSALAGTTRDWVAETALIQGWPAQLVDTAGLRHAGCEIEAEAIRRSRERAQLADVVICLLDATAAAQELQAARRSAHDAVPRQMPMLTVLNKCDVERARHVPADCRISALSGEGVAELEGRIAALLGLDQLDERLPTGFRPQHVFPEHT